MEAPSHPSVVLRLRDSFVLHSPDSEMHQLRGDGNGTTRAPEPPQRHSRGALGRSAMVLSACALIPTFAASANAGSRVVHSPPSRSHVEPARAATGRIDGTAILSSKLVKSRLRVRVYDEPGSAPPAPAADANPLANVVMYLESTASLRTAVAPSPASIATALHQTDERFSPHVLPVTVGATVQFPNDDPIFHNVFSLSSAATFDLGRFPSGASKSVTFHKAGVAQIFCHIHADMNAYVLVLDHPFFVVPDANGHFALDAVPPGDYELMAWHERIKPFSTRIHVDANKTTTISVRVPIPEDPK